MFEFVRNFETRLNHLSNIRYQSVLFANKDIENFKLAVNEFIQISSEIKKFEIKAELPGQLKKTIQRVLHELEDVAGRRRPAPFDKVSFDKDLDILHNDFMMFREQIAKEEKTIERQKKVLAKESKELEKEKSGAEDLVNSFKPLYTKHASYHNTLRKVFLGAAFVFTALTLVFIYWVSLLSTLVNFFNWEEGQSLIDKAVESPPLLFFGLLVWAIQLCIQEYRANSHYYLEYESKVTTLEMFDNLLAAQKIDKENYLPLFTLVLEKIIDNPSSAYIKNEPPKIMPVSINRI